MENIHIWAEIFSGKYIDLFTDTPCDLPQIENGNIAQYYYSFKSYYFPMHKGKKLSYSCVVGYTTESGTQDGRITCTAEGWSPVPRCYSELAFFISFTEMDFKLHEKLQYKCNPGYLTPTLCLPHGWDLPPRCTSTEVAHGGFYPVKKTYEEGDVVHFFCDKHYSVTGFDLIQCYNFGWYPDPPVCEEMQQDCASPPVIENGAVLGPVLASYKNGSWVEYVCHHYHFLDGPSTVYCHQGNWTEQPTCLGESWKENIKLHCHMELRNLLRWLLIKIHFYFPEPCTLNVTDMDSNNLTLKWRREELIFLHGDLIEFECKQGYSFLQTAIPSPGRTQCDQGRVNYPKCVIQAATEKCGSPPSIANGALTVPALPQYDSGSSVQYICSDYHFLQGSERIYCSEGQWTSPPVCIEPCTLSKTEMEKNNVLLQAFYADQVYFYHGDYVGFYCKQNHFGAESGTTLFQVQCERGQLAYPRCVERGKQVWT
uniref:Coagulation factor XIII B chain n=1 Tax=Serinus canaria TaxID=9135 RepID=A0A8C9NAL0_SERCA